MVSPRSVTGLSPPADLYPAVCLMGPTASGKTDLAVHLCENFPFDIVSVDASQVYRGMDIGTAKPAADVLARVPHRLINIRNLAQTYSAAEFRNDALREMADIRSHCRIPLLVGGTMFYFRALEANLSPLPAANAACRERIVRRAALLGWPALHRELAAVDPSRAASIDPNDAQRIQRALEIIQLTGQPVAAAPVSPRGLPYRLVKLAIVPSDRRLLHHRIGARFRHMLEQGVVDEVRGLLNYPGFSTRLPAMKTVGYRQILRFLSHELSYDQMVDNAVAATRQLAKRQLTWLRNQPGVTWIDSAGNAGRESELKTTLAAYISGKLRILGV